MLLSRKMRIPLGTNWIMYVVPTTKVEMASIQQSRPTFNISSKPFRKEFVKVTRSLNIEGKMQSCDELKKTNNVYINVSIN